MGQLYIDTNKGSSGDPYKKGDNMPEVNGKQPSEKVQRLLANWDIKKHQPYATHKAFEKISKENAEIKAEVVEIKAMIKAIADKK